MKILVIQQKRIGDVLMGSVICNNLRKCFPKAEIHYSVYRFTQAVVMHNPNIDKIISFEDAYRNPLRLFGFIAQIRRERYDILIDAYEKLESWLISRFSGIPIRISYEKPYRQYIYNRLEKTVGASRTSAGKAIENRVALLNSLNTKNLAYDYTPRVFLTQAERQWARDYLKSKGVDEQKPLLMVGIFGSVPSKTWPAEFMKIGVERLMKEEVQLLFSYFPHQRREAERFYERLRDRRKLFFQVKFENLRQMSALVELCTLYFGNDCSYPHIAKAVGTPTITLFAPFIKKDHWSTFEDGIQNLGVHLSDFEPECVENREFGSLHKRYRDYYLRMTPERVLEKVWPFLSLHLWGGKGKSFTFARY